LVKHADRFSTALFFLDGLSGRALIIAEERRHHPDIKLKEIIIQNAF
jgi:pterin-4a-carbinolamine dehydratase